MTLHNRINIAGTKNLANADLRGINLHRRNLTSYDFSGANLRGANLSNTRLRRANFSEADLSGANLSGSDLTGALFIRANLKDVDFGQDIYANGKVSRQLDNTDNGNRFNGVILNDCNIHQIKFYTDKQSEIKLCTKLLTDLENSTWDLNMKHYHGNFGYCDTTHCLAGYISMDVEYPSISAFKKAPTLAFFFYAIHLEKPQILQILKDVVSQKVSIFDEGSLWRYLCDFNKYEKGC